MSQFKCFSCKQLSGYKRRVGAARIEMGRMKSVTENERRTYECELLRNRERVREARDGVDGD
jgi:hypothetical protein